MIKDILFGDKRISRWIRAIINHFPFNNSIHCFQNKVLLSNALLRNSSIRINGHDNNIVIGNHVYLTNLHILITGNNNNITINDSVVGDQVDICVEDNKNTISIGAHTKFAGKIHLACTESTSISIGEDCLFSSEIVIRTGDSHSILDKSGERINPAVSVKIGDHVWVGHRAMITKGSVIGEDTVVGTGAIVTKKFTQSNVVLAGVPAKVVSEGIYWNISRVNNDYFAKLREGKVNEK